MPKFSVVIPLYNGADFIEKTLNSVLGQTYKDYEIILVNDESPDNVGETVKIYIKKHPHTKFVYLEQKNKGLGGARNTALRQAKGEIIAILDQDDLWYPEKLERVEKIYAQQPEVDLVCHNCNINRSGKIKGVYRTGPASQELYRDMLFGGNRLFTLTTTFKRALIDQAGYFSEERDKLHFAEDYDLWLRLAKMGCCFYFMPEVLAEYIQHDNNFSLTGIKRMLQSELYVVNKHYAGLEQKHPLDWYRLRRRKAKILYMAACRSFVSVQTRWGGIGYLPAFSFSFT